MRKLLLCLLAVCLTPALAATAAAPAAPAGAARAEPAVASLRFATLNTAASLSVRKAVSDIRTVLEQDPDVVTLQEMSSWEKRVKVREKFVDCGRCEYDAFIPVPAVQGGQPILWRSDTFELVDQGWDQVTEDTWVGEQGAGPATIRAKYIVWVRLRELTTGRQLYVLNNHFVPTVQAEDGGRNSNTRRIAIYQKHMNALRTKVEGIQDSGRSVFVTGDFNVNYRKDKIERDTAFPYYNMGLVDVRASYYALGEPRTGTHVLSNGFDLRLIDYVHFWARRMVVPQAQRIMLGLNSDHRPLVTDFELLGKGCFRRGERVC